MSLKEWLGGGVGEGGGIGYVISNIFYYIILYYYHIILFLHSVACIKTCTDGGANQVYRIADDQHER